MLSLETVDTIICVTGSGIRRKHSQNTVPSKGLVPRTLAAFNKSDNERVHLKAIQAAHYMNTKVTLCPYALHFVTAGSNILAATRCTCQHRDGFEHQVENHDQGPKQLWHAEFLRIQWLHRHFRDESTDAFNL